MLVASFGIGGVPMAEERQELDEPFIRDFTERWLAAWNSKDPNQVLALCSQDVVWDESGVVGRLEGHDAVREQSLRPFFDAFPDVQIEYIDEPYLAVDGKKAARRWRIGGTMTGAWNPPGFAPTNSPVTLEGAEFWQFAGELVSDYTLLFDALNLGQQIGAAPKTGTMSDRVGFVMQRLAARKMRRDSARGRGSAS
jgi:hypothetical protein